MSRFFQEETPKCPVLSRSVQICPDFTGQNWTNLDKTGHFAIFPKNKKMSEILYLNN